jgi:diguanylate cyclase (GGDEF)-like protein
MKSNNVTMIDATAARSRAAHAEPDAEARARILIVDDIAENREILSRRLLRKGFEVMEADGGRRALDLIDKHSFDLVLLDVMMPDLDGVVVLQTIRNQFSPSALPVIMVTAKGESESVVEALQHGANDYVTKPVDFPVVVARMSAQLSRKRAEEAARVANSALSELNRTLELRIEERTRELIEANENLKGEIADRCRAEARIRYLAYYDALTGLPNRVSFREELDQALADSAAHGSAFAVLLLDLDGFKAVNDTVGHALGDKLLKAVGDRLRENLHGSAIPARLGGDEFAFILNALADPQDAADCADKVIAALNEPFILDGHQVAIGASCGISLAPVHGTAGDQLLKKADVSLYGAKAKGRNTYCMFSPEMDSRAQERRQLEMEMRNAFAEGAFEVYYQPVYKLETRTISGFEALLRWNHQERGSILPSEFIPLAEETGMIVALGEWVLRQACTEAATWPSAIRVAVNLSPIQFRTGKLVQAVLSALASSGLPPSRLELEITESVLLDATEQNLATLEQLRTLGVRISMDDFGTGYSNLNYLRRFRFDKIKIDQSFVRGLNEDRCGKEIVHLIAGLGVSIGVETHAEGVENEDQLEALMIQGCTEVQGYLFGRAMQASEIRPLLLRTAAGREVRQVPSSNAA